MKNYGGLRIETQTPWLLVVLELPREEVQWLTVTTEKLVLRRRACWLSLQRNHREIMGQQTVTVHIPEQNIFDVETLRDLMVLNDPGKENFDASQYPGSRRSLGDFAAGVIRLCPDGGLEQR